MINRLYQSVVVLLWLAAMSWLMFTKILPPFFNGEPPRAERGGDGGPVAWRVEVDGQECGVAVSRRRSGVQGTEEVHSRVRINRLSLPNVLPTWGQTLLSSMGVEQPQELSVDLRNRATFQVLGDLASFQSRLTLNEYPAEVVVDGRIGGGLLRVRMQTGGFVHNYEHPWREKSLLKGSLFPETRLVGVRAGQRWQEEVISPLGGPASAAELIEAEVESQETLLLEGKIVPAYRIVYRNANAAGVSANQRRRAVLWVDERGEVLRQDSYWMNTRLRFVRMPQEESEGLANQLLGAPTPMPRKSERRQ